MDYPQNEVLLYDLGNRPASYDFVTCLATAVGMGFKHVRFVYGKWKPKNYSIQSAEERWKSIVQPAVALYGLTYSIGERYGVEVSHMLGAAIDLHKKSGRIGKIKWPCKAGEYVTLTLRKSRNPERNSNEEESLKFARHCDRKVIVIRDWDERPISLEDRMTLYAGAYTNIMVINGPVTLCVHSDAPYICMRTIGDHRSHSTNPQFLAAMGITPGFQFPWAIAGQKMSYLDDTCENLMAEYSLLQERLAA